MSYNPYADGLRMAMVGYQKRIEDLELTIARCNAELALLNRYLDNTRKALSDHEKRSH